MLDTWFWTDEDFDSPNIGEVTADKVRGALAMGGTVYVLGDPITAEIFAVFALDADAAQDSGNANDLLPTVLSERKILVPTA